MVLIRGVVHVEVLPNVWEVDGERLASAVGVLPTVLRKMLRNHARLPRTLFTDRETGMCTPGGQAVHQYAKAVEETGFHLFWGHMRCWSSEIHAMRPHQETIVPSLIRLRTKVPDIKKPAF